MNETLLFVQEQDEDDEEEEGSLKDFIDDDGTSDEESVGSDSDIQEVEETGEEKKRTTRGDKVIFFVELERVEIFSLSRRFKYLSIQIIFCLALEHVMFVNLS